MPIRGINHSNLVSDEAPFFRTLAELDQWEQTPSSSKKLEGVLPYTARSDIVHASERGKLLVCHDYKGGYTESSTSLSYTFNFWPYCETFIYFSHHRVTIPPSGWSTAAHRQGVKMLGTLIFEHAESEPDCLRLLVGALPNAKTGPAKTSSSVTLPVSPHYARLLADLAYQRGFDGYLLNFEAPLRGGVEQTRALTMWIAMLEHELRRKVGAHAEVIWYDSIIVDGRLRWQDRLNSVNLPFLLPSTGFFSNYTWPSPYPSMTAQYLLSLDQTSYRQQKRLRDLYIGVDVWGRGSHGGGGFGLFKAISHVDPESLGLSVALFGHAWTWESEQDKPDWSWKAWWEYESKLWVGPRTDDEEIHLPDTKGRPGEPPCDHGPFKPIADFFPRQPPPNPASRPFFTTFCPGVGWSWFVRGTRVFQSETGWTDLDKATSVGDLVFPRPLLAWEDGERTDALPEATSDLSMDDAWLGGSSLAITLSAPGSDAEDAFFRCVWLPIQSLAITSRTSYRLSVIFKAEGAVDTDVGASVRPLSKDLGTNVEFEIIPIASMEALPGGWTELIIDFSLLLERTVDVLSAVGLVVGFACEDPTQPVTFSVHVGAISVSANPMSPALAGIRPKILWADFVRVGRQGGPGSAVSLAGALSWGTGVSLGPVPSLTITSPEDPQPSWILDDCAPGFAYFNVYAAKHAGEGTAVLPEDATFVGTTGLDGRANRFYVDPTCIPESIRDAKTVRLFVQGVSDKGQVLEWEECAFVDVDV